MKKRYILTIITAFLLVLSLLIYAASGSLTTFDGQTNPYNITFTGSENKTYYLEVPMYAYFNNISITIQGVENT